MLNHFFIFIGALFMVARGSTAATTYASKLARYFRLPTYTVGFLVIAIISILPETFIAINAGLKGIPSFGLGMLFGSNIADLSLIVAICIWSARRNIKVESKILKQHAVYPFLLLLPLVLGFNGHFSRMEGLALIIAGGVFYYSAFREGGTGDAAHAGTRRARMRALGSLLLSMAILLIGAHFTVSSAVAIAEGFGISPILIGMLVVGLGTTMPELFFSLRSLKKHDDALAIGDLLGTVLADATIVVGLLALITPFSFPQRIVYVTGVFMVLAAVLLFRSMKSGRQLTGREAWLLFFFWLAFVVVEFFATVS